MESWIKGDEFCLKASQICIGLVIINAFRNDSLRHYLPNLLQKQYFEQYFTMQCMMSPLQNFLLNVLGLRATQPKGVHHHPIHIQISLQRNHTESCNGFTTNAKKKTHLPLGIRCALWSHLNCYLHPMWTILMFVCLVQNAPLTTSSWSYYRTNVITQIAIDFISTLMIS